MSNKVESHSKDDKISQQFKALEDEKIKRKSSVVDFLSKFQQDNGRSPTVEERASLANEIFGDYADISGTIEEANSLRVVLDELVEEEVSRKKVIDDWINSFKDKNNGREPTDEEKAEEGDLFTMYQEIVERRVEADQSLTAHLSGAIRSFVKSTPNTKRRMALSDIKPTLNVDENITSDNNMVTEIDSVIEEGNSVEIDTITAADTIDPVDNTTEVNTTTAVDNDNTIDNDIVEDNDNLKKTNEINQSEIDITSHDKEISNEVSHDSNIEQHNDTKAITTSDPIGIEKTREQVEEDAALVIQSAYWRRVEHKEEMLQRQEREREKLEQERIKREKLEKELQLKRLQEKRLVLEKQEHERLERERIIETDITIESKRRTINSSQIERLEDEIISMENEVIKRKQRMVNWLKRFQEENGGRYPTTEEKELLADDVITSYQTMLKIKQRAEETLADLKIKKLLGNDGKNDDDDAKNKVTVQQVNPRQELPEGYTHSNTALSKTKTNVHNTNNSNDNTKVEEQVMLIY
jgi:hypothetical protein